jgi:hypothetical protein
MAGTWRIAVDKKNASASQHRGVLEEVLRVARAENASATVSGSGKPRVLLTKQLTDNDELHVRALLSGIEFATHSHFGHGMETSGISEWVLRSRYIDVTLRCIKASE